jgi:rSAM/selenodomain-associated transferase 1
VAEFDPSTHDVLLFAKYPEAGRCKTRLAETLGSENALLIYRALLEHSLAVMRSLECTRVLYVDPPERTETGSIWAPGLDLYFPQSQGDLGSRLQSAIAERLQFGEKKIVLIGSDCPQISKGSILSTFAALNEADVVLGPTEDGGYYLLGLKASHPVLFQDIPWSSERVLEKTLNVLKIHSLSYILLETFSDVDTLRDFQRVRHLEPLKNLGIR